MRIIKSHLLHAEVCRSPWFPPRLALAAPPRALAPREPAEASGGTRARDTPPLESTYGPSRQLSNSGKLGRSGNEGNKCWHSRTKKKLFSCAEDTCERCCLLLPTVFFWNRFAFSRREWSEAMKSAWSHKDPNLAQPDPSWGKTAPGFGNTNIAGVCNRTMLKQELQIILKRGRNELYREFLDLSQNTLGSPCFLSLLFF